MPLSVSIFSEIVSSLEDPIDRGRAIVLGSPASASFTTNTLLTGD
jgi:hypothetical protein